jgi:hypothetical protein
MSHALHALGVATKCSRPEEARTVGLWYPTSVECILCGSVDPKAEILAIQTRRDRIIACFMINPGTGSGNVAYEQGLLTTRSYLLPAVYSSFSEEADIHLIPSTQQKRL